MKKQIQLFVLIFSVSVLASCSFTNKTGSASNFNKKHYNRGFVKKKKQSKEKTTVLHKIEKEAAIFNDTKEMQTTTEKNVVENKADVFEHLQKDIESKKEEMLVLKENASSKKEEKKYEKAYNKLERVEKMIRKFEPKFLAKSTAYDYDDDDYSRGEKKGIASLVLGAVGFFFGFLILNIAAVVLGSKAMKESDSNSDGYLYGRIGRILGFVGIGLLLFALLLIILFLLLAF